MLLSSDLASSELFAVVKKGGLPHPTSTNFDAQPWIEALKQIEDKKPRDLNLAFAALHFGLQIASLRAAHAAELVNGLCRSSGLRLMAAIANQQYLTLMAKVHAANGLRDRNQPVHFEHLDQTPVTNIGGQEMTGDDHVTHLVDTLPHWAHHIMTLPADGNWETPLAPDQVAARAIMISSVERSLRDLWQESLWTGHFVDPQGGKLVHRPLDPPSAERWFVWEQRQQTLLGQELYIDLGAHMVAGSKLAPAKRVLNRTVTKSFRGPSGKRRYKLGAVTGRKPVDRIRVSEHDALERLYTGLFLDEELPGLAPHKITCRLLNKAWWLIADLARINGDEAGELVFNDDAGVERFTFAINKEELGRLLSDGLSVSPDKAATIVDFMAMNLEDTKALFGRGFWSAPLLPDPSHDQVYLLAAPLLIGSPIRRVESWFERGGLTDRAGIKGRGKPFEDHVRKTVAKALAGNALLSDHSVPEHALKRKGTSEEIDLLVRIGRTLLVAEVKCFVYPSEPLERFNYLKNVEGAARQARDKAAWVDRNRGKVGTLLGIDDLDQVQALRIVPLVVTNHGFGFGLTIEGAVVTDLHYLKLLMGSGQYQGDTVFERNVGTAHRNVQLYCSQADFEKRVVDIFARPRPLERYVGKVGWQQIPFPTNGGSPFELMIPVLTAPPMSAPMSVLPPRF